MLANSVDQIEKILVKWCYGRSSGRISLVNRTAVEEGTITIGQKVMVVWGKSKKAYEAEVINVSGAQTPAPCTCTTSRTKEVYFSTSTFRSLDFTSYIHCYSRQKAFSKPATHPAAVGNP